VIPAPVVALLDRCSFPPAGTPVTCAVSGGRDSLALLVLATAAGCDVSVTHVDHGLRPETATEAKTVAEAAARFGARFETIAVAVEPGPNLEARARAARYAVLPPGVLTGHTADDQAETVLLNLLRGAGLDGLGGMGRGGPGAPIRPLIRLRRSDTGGVCAAAGLVPIDDPTNLDPSIRRNRVRHEILPLLDDVAGRDVVAVLARQAELLAADAKLLDALAIALDPTDAGALAAAPVPLARRAIRAWLRSTDERHPPDSAAVERVLDVARGMRLATEIAGGRRVARTSGRLRVEPIQQ
jgi:tRNA(Ile)-lysidine synthase